MILTYVNIHDNFPMKTMNKKIGSYLVIQITGETKRFIAEVAQENPLILKVEESGPYSALKSGDFILDEDLSKKIQDPQQEKVVLEEAVARGCPFVSGLASLGVSDGKLHSIFPSSD